MLIRHIQLEDIQRVAESLDCKFEGTDIGVRFPRVRGRLIPNRAIPKEDRPYRRVSASIMFNEGREVFAVCWHGHRDFFRALFAEFPSATVQSGLAQRAGVKAYTADNFESVFPSTGSINVGAPIAPVCAAEVCKCPEGSF